MKKLFSILAIAAVATLAFVSCSKDDGDGDGDGNNNYKVGEITGTWKATKAYFHFGSYSTIENPDINYVFKSDGTFTEHNSENTKKDKAGTYAYVGTDEPPTVVLYYSDGSTTKAEITWTSAKEIEMKLLFSFGYSNFWLTR